MIRKTKILAWLVVLLLILNAATIATILYHNYREKKMQSDVMIRNSYGGQMINGRFLRQELGFDAAQMDLFREINQDFRPQAMGMTYQIDSLKSEMFDEMKKELPDTTRLNQLSGMIGERHGLLKHKTYRLFLDVKKICTPEQKAELEEVFQPLFKNELNTNSPGLQYRRGWRNNQKP
ncbi:MAG: hypothetical protein QM725_09845 [Lacibacter sp.]